MITNNIILSGNSIFSGDMILGFEVFIPTPHSIIYDDFRTGSYTDLDHQVGGLGWQINGYTASYHDEFNYLGLKGYDGISYLVNIDINGQNLGVGWSYPFLDHPNPFGLQTRDELITYSSGSFLSGLNGGSSWAGLYTSSRGYTGLFAYDSLNDYTSGSLLNELNGGIGWSGQYLDSDSGSVP